MVVLYTPKTTKAIQHREKISLRAITFKIYRSKVNLRVPYSGKNTYTNLVTYNREEARLPREEDSLSEENAYANQESP